MAEYRKDCPCCNEFRLERLVDYVTAHLCRCASCGFVFAGKVPTPSELEAHYAHKYQNKYNPSAWVSETTLKRLDQLVQTFAPHRLTNRLLDVGCGRGLTLEAAAKAGWECHGTEYSKDALGFLQERGFAMHEGDLLPGTYPEEHFDVIVMTEVIEHLAEPRKELELIASLLRPGGLLYLTTPNFDSLSRRVLKGKWNVIGYPFHLSYFTIATLQSLLGRLSLRVLRSDTTGFSPTRFRKSITGRAHQQNSASDADERVRNALEARPHLLQVKSGLNFALSKSRLGDSLKVYAEKAPSASS